jgi:Inner membrane protein YgaP-like, transmembrane domain
MITKAHSNIGLTDRSIRTLLGIGLIGFAVSGDRTGYEWLGWIGILPLVTGLFGICPVYSMLGINTRGY